MHPDTPPFRIVALAPFRPAGSGEGAATLLPVERGDLDRAIGQMQVTLPVALPRELCPDGSVVLGFSGLRDFHPDSMIRNCAYLRGLREALDLARTAGGSDPAAIEARNRLSTWPGLPFEAQLESPGLPRAGGSAVDAILDMVALPGEARQPSSGTSSLAARLESTLLEILARVTAAAAFRETESAWRGLRWLLAGTERMEDSSRVSVGIATVHPDSLARDLERLLPELVGDPPALLLLDAPFDNSPRCMEQLEQVASLAETVLAPCLVWVTSGFFHLEGWAGLPGLPFLPHQIAGASHAKWRRLRESPKARWISALCNRFLAREAYGADSPIRSLPFQEREALWTAPVWALGSLILQSLARTGWPSRFTDREAIRLQGLPVHRPGGGKAIAAEFAVDTDRLEQFVKVGLLPLVPLPDRDILFAPLETTVSGGPLSHQLILARIVHVLLRCRDAMGPGATADGVRSGLEEALGRFWERTGHPPPQLEVTLRQAGPGQGSKVLIVIQPSREISPGGGRIELEIPC